MQAPINLELNVRPTIETVRVQRFNTQYWQLREPNPIEHTVLMRNV
jgi:hypothetical protein